MIKYQEIALVVLTGMLVLAGCSRSSNQPATKQTLAVDGGPSLPPLDGEASPSSVVEGKDNSEITTVKDNYGIIVETRVFRSHDLLDNVVVKTLGDGSKFGYAVTKEGDKRTLSDNHIAVALTVSGDDLANSLGLRQPEPMPASDPGQASLPAAQAATTAAVSEPIPMPPPAMVSQPTADPADERRRQAELKRAEEERIRRLQREVTRIGKP